MNASDARALLGVGVDAGPDEVRRAYLRACRRHRPETDPEGFQRVRAAYELLRSGDPFGDWPDGAMPPIEVGPAPIAAPQAPAPEDERVPPPVPVAAPAPDLAPRVAWLSALEPEALLDREPIEDLEACAAEAAAGLAVHLGAGASRDVASLVMLVLALWARGRTTGAQLLLAALRREPLSGLGAAGALLPLVRELEVIRENNPPMAGAIAEALVRQNDVPFARWLRGEAASDRSLSRELIVVHAPSLAARFGRVLDAHAPRGVREWSAPSPWYWLVALIGTIGLASGRITCTHKGPPTLPPIPESLVPGPRDERKALCAIGRATCDQHEVLARAIARGDCAAALKAWRAFADRVPPIPALAGVRSRLVQRCGPIPATTTDLAPTTPPMTAPPPGPRDGAP